MGRPIKNIVRTLDVPDLKKMLLNAVMNGDKVEVIGLGTFEIVHIPQKKVFHNFSKRTRVIKAYNKLKFTQSSLLKEHLTYAKD